MVKTKKTSKSGRKKFEKPRLYSRAIVIGARKSKHKLKPGSTVIEIEGVKSKRDAQFYVGKKVAFLFGLKEGIKSKKRSNPNKFIEGKRVMWGEVTRYNGNSGHVRAKFENNLPGWSQGMKCRVYMY